MSDEEKEPSARFAKGDRVAITGGRKNLGVRGEVFWIGENKYGPGVRYGIKDDDGETYWVDETKLGSPDEAPPPPEKPPREDKPALAKGARVEITGGEGRGETGEVFWVGESKFGQGMRYGVRCEGDATYWVDDKFVEPLDTPADAVTAPAPVGESASPTSSKTSGHAPPVDDAPMPDPDEFQDFPEAPEDDAPFPDDDVPF